MPCVAPLLSPLVIVFFPIRWAAQRAPLNRVGIGQGLAGLAFTAQALLDPDDGARSPVLGDGKRPSRGAFAGMSLTVSNRLLRKSLPCTVPDGQ